MGIVFRYPGQLNKAGIQYDSLQDEVLRILKCNEYNSFLITYHSFDNFN